MQVRFSLGAGSTYSTTAGSWGTTIAWNATGATSVVGTSGATFYITGCQLEKGTTATNFDVLPYTTELALCQRYYNRVVGAGSSLALFMRQNSTAFGNSIALNYPFKVTMRTAPTWTRLGTWATGNSGQPFANVTTAEYATICTDSVSTGDAYAYANATTIGFEVSSEL
jgi:hypothetical protein